MTALLSNTALLEAIKDTPEYRDLVLSFEAKAKEALESGVYEVKALGTSLSLPQVAATYQAFKGQPKSLGSAWSKAVSTECLAIIKKAGYKADWNGIVSLVAHEAK
jgi:hypothetical protein